MAHLPFPSQRATLAPPRVEKLWMPREHTLEDLHELLLQEEKALRKKMKAASLSGSHRIPPFFTAPFVDPNTERDVAEEDYDSERDEHHLNDGLDDDDGYDDEEEEEEDDNGFPGQPDLREGTEERTPSVAGQELMEDDNDDMELDMVDVYIDPSEYVHDVDEETHHLHQQFQFSSRRGHNGSSSPELRHDQHYTRGPSNHHAVHPESHTAYTDSDYEMIGNGGPTTDQLYTDQDFRDDRSVASAEYWEDPEDEEDGGPYRIGSPGHTPRPSP
ncbi:hypothetical protein EMPS_09002 [Entomortierella parvispora]|uniref:Uncharacterized protein n=1 Tax=Entomortierella parvispora TaxID=205924 RepID=A0A9P3LZW6_9FUNG|nr:hypothetical protein EMPS_09002 [Entomortierella parvispora]